MIMETPKVGEFITYCRCRSWCPSGLPHGDINVTNKLQLIKLWSEHEICTVYNIGFDVVRRYDLNGSAVLCIGDKIAVCHYPGTSGSEIVIPAKIEYFDNVRAILAKYKRVTDAVEILALKERLAELEQFVAQHLYYAPGGIGASKAGADWISRLPDKRE